MTPDADYPSLSELITTKEGLENVLGRPDPRVLAKVAKALDDLCLAFIARSRFLNALDDMCLAFIARSPFVSPKGDPAGVERAGPSDGRNPRASRQPAR